MGGSNNRYLRCTCKNGDDLRTVHNDQLVYLNHQDIALTLVTQFKIWLIQTKEKDLSIKIVTALLLYNSCTLLNMMEICVTNNNTLTIHYLKKDSKSWELFIFDCCKQSLTRLWLPSIHPSIHPPTVQGFQNFLLIIFDAHIQHFISGI